MNDGKNPWYDVLYPCGKLFNIVRAVDSADALARSNEQAHLIGIGTDMERRNPNGAYAQLTPTNGKHPF